MTEGPERTAVYHIHGEAHVLLYIGLTSNPSVRWNQHQASQPWWEELRSLTVEWYDSRPEAEAAEKAAILAEQPKYNVTYLKPWRPRRERKQQPEAVPVERGKARLEPRASDEDLPTTWEAGEMTRLGAGRLQEAIAQTAGPPGFTLAGMTLWRRGEIRQWLADVEAAQQPETEACTEEPAA